MTALIFPIQNFVALPYKGTFTGINVSLLSSGGAFTNDGQQLRSGRQSKCVNASMDWLADYPGQAVTINLQAQNTSSPLDQLLMVYVDNELNSSNVTIYFPDTQMFVGVPAFTTGYYPVLTGQQLCTVYNGTTGQPPVTKQSVTSILFCNFALPGFLAQETLSITFNSSNGPIIPTIGDKFANASLNINGTNGNVVVLSSVTPPQRYVLTAITLSGTGLFIDSTGAPQYITIALADGATIIRQITYFMTYSLYAGFQFTNLSQETDLNIPVQSVSLSFAAGSNVPSIGLVNVDLTYAELTL